MSDIINKELEDIKLQYYYCKVSSIKYKKYSDVSNILLLIHQPLVTISIYNKVCCGRFLPLSTIFPAIHLYLNFKKNIIIMLPQVVNIINYIINIKIKHFLILIKYMMTL
jgi:hypothetical protein